MPIYKQKLRLLRRRGIMSQHPFVAYLDRLLGKLPPLEQEHLFKAIDVYRAQKLEVYIPHPVS